jgi:PqqD family protein of HPr-rel-A system
VSVTPAPNPAIETAFLVNQAVLFDERDGRVHELNPSASAVWLLLDGTLTLDEVAAELEELLGVDQATVRADLDAVVADFADRGLLEGTEPIADDPHHGHDHAEPSAPGHDRGQHRTGLTVLPKPPEP